MLLEHAGSLVPRYMAAYHEGQVASSRRTYITCCCTRTSPVADPGEHVARTTRRMKVFSEWSPPSCCSAKLVARLIHFVARSPWTAGGTSCCTKGRQNSGTLPKLGTSNGKKD